MTDASSSVVARSLFSSSKVVVPVLGAGDQIGEGDTHLIENILPPELADVAFENLRKEVAWNVMHHRGALPPSMRPVVLPDRTPYRWRSAASSGSRRRGRCRWQVSVLSTLAPSHTIPPPTDSLQLPHLPPPGRRIAPAVPILAYGGQDPRARRARATAPSQPRANTALPLRRRLHLGALRQDDRRRARLAHREPLAWRAAHHDTQDEERLPAHLYQRRR